MTNTITLADYAAAEKALLEPDLMQSLYDEGGVLMDKVLVTLHGEEHRTRRTLEMKIFRRDYFRYYEDNVLPGVLESSLAPFLEQGRADVVDFGQRVMIALTVAFAGIDRPDGTSEETEALLQILRGFGIAPSLGQSHLDRDELRRQVLDAIAYFDTRFYTPSAERRLAELERFKRGEITEEELPRDVLTILLRNEDRIELNRDLLLRETGFFYLAGAHTSVHSMGHVMHHLLTWCEAHPGDRARLVSEPVMLQRFVHESFRLHPSSPVAKRRALSRISFLDGQTAEPGDTGVI
ncbi:MAG: cytochrome P450, partial [Caulobacterales bacterium]|nr:cytochrome P450 [Caulobacterales bacterium]